MTIRLLLAGLLGLLLTLTTACTPSVSHYAGGQPSLDLRQYFNGTVQAWGLVQDYRDTVTRRFSVRIEASWQGDTGTLNEYFRFDDGEQQFRRWTLTRIDQHHYRGIADDVVGEAVGEISGNALRWQYTLRVPIDDTTYDIAFDDWMFLLDERHMFNKATMRKFGISVGEVTLFFQKPDSGPVVSVAE